MCLLTPYLSTPTKNISPKNKEGRKCGQTFIMALINHVPLIVRILPFVSQLHEKAKGKL
jgi:hypothetical protein